MRRLGPSDAEAYVQLRSAMLSAEPLAFLASASDDIASQVEALRTRMSHEENVIFGAFATELVGALGVLLYESLGFRLWGTEPQALRHAGRMVSEHHMVLLLDS